MAMQKFPFQTGFYRGKVRDVYYLGNEWLVMIASNRISAFDVILPETIPFKGEVLNRIAATMLNETKDICPNWLVETPAPNASLGIRCQPYKVEMVVRGNLTGHSWRTYSSGKRILCGVALPEGMKENDFFPEPIITPSTKADAGHDEDISREEILARGIVPEEDYLLLEKYALALFERGGKIAESRGLILADTKYEFGKANGKVYLMDEVHTPDSSRYFFLEGFQERQLKGERQKQLSKEFVREWLIANNFMGRPGDVIPEMTSDWIQSISARYIELFERLTGEKFTSERLTEEEIFDRITTSINMLNITP